MKGVSYEWNNHGQLVKRTLQGFQFANQQDGYMLTSLSVMDDNATFEYIEQSYRYDSLGRLVSVTSSERPELWQWDGLALVARGDDAYINEGHVSGASALMSRSLSEGDERYLLTDYLGTTLAAFDAKGDRNEPTEATAWNVMRTSFGVGSDSPEAMSRFTGKPYDADLGAHVFPYRNYRSDMGRWMSADPIGFPDGPNQHFYAPVPTVGVDPWGLAEWHVKITSGSQDAVGGGLFADGEYAAVWG